MAVGAEVDAEAVDAVEVTTTEITTAHPMLMQMDTLSPLTNTKLRDLDLCVAMTIMRAQSVLTDSLCAKRRCR